MSFEFHASPEDERKLNVLRVRDAAFDAVRDLWNFRKSQGMTQADLCKAMDRDSGWLSRNLGGPGNWTLKTFGEFVGSLDGYVKIVVTPREHVAPSNYDIYECWKSDHLVPIDTIKTTLNGDGPNTAINLQVGLPVAMRLIPVKAITHAG